MTIPVLFVCFVLSFQLGESITLCDTTKDISRSTSGSGVNTVKIIHNLDSSQIEINWIPGTTSTIQAAIEASAATNDALDLIQATLKNESAGVIEVDIEYTGTSSEISTGSTKAPFLALVIMCFSFFMITSKNRIFFTSFLVAFVVALLPLVYGSGCIAINANVTVPPNVQQLCIQGSCQCNQGWTGENCATPVDQTTGTVANPSTGTTRNPTTGTTHNPSTGTTHNPSTGTTANPTTANPTTAIPTTANPTTANPTTANPTTANPTTENPTTANPTTANPTTANPTTENPTTENPTTANPTTQNPTTANPTTQNPTTANPTTQNPTTATTGTTGTTGAFLQVIQDPSFETLIPWTYYDALYGSSQCDASCGGPLPQTAYDGNEYEWCGGGAADFCYIYQNVTIPNGDAYLSIWTIVLADGNAVYDRFFVTFDWNLNVSQISDDEFFNHTLIHLTNLDSYNYQNWTNIEVDIPPQYEDNQAHILWIVADITGPGADGIKWDDVEILSYPGRTTGNPI